MKNSLILIGAAAICLTGCASIVSQSSWPVTITSSPDQASFMIVNEEGQQIHRGVTPATVTLNSGSGYFDGATYHLKCSKEGSKDGFALIDSSINGWYWANILFGGIIGMLVIDPATGAMWKLPKQVSLELAPE